MINFELGGVVVTDTAGFNIQQNYSAVDGGSALLRAMSGKGIRQTRWEKIRISTSGTGWIPSALRELDTDADHVIKCVTPMHKQQATNVITIPTARRTDTGSDPFGMAFVNGSWVDVGASLSVNDVTVTVTAGATLYRACWYPEYTVSIISLNDDGDLGSPSYPWSLVVEQV